MKFNIENKWLQLLLSVAGFGVGYYLMTMFEKLFQ